MNVMETIEPALAQTLPVLTSGFLSSRGIRHAFFTRAGGVSEGVYASLNGGTGSRDEPAAVGENRARMAAAIGVAASRLLVPYQIHSADALHVATAWAPGERPRVDALVTSTPGLGIGVTGADCGILLFLDAKNGVIGAAHAGWKGALTGILEATIEAMERCGAQRRSIVAALGPTIGAGSYEVGEEFIARFSAASADYARFFVPSNKAGHSMFDLPGFIGARLDHAGIADFDDLALDTYADEQRFFSYRRMVHRGETDYGRLVAAIAIS